MAVGFAVLLLLLLAGLTRLLSPVDSLNKQLAVAGIIILCGAGAFFLVRRFRFLPCPNCQGELRMVAAAAWQRRQHETICPRCGAAVKV